MDHTTSGAGRSRSEPLTVWAIDYTTDDVREKPEQYRLLTTLLDPADASAPDLTASYSQRREMGLAFNELKTHQPRPARYCASAKSSRNSSSS